MKNFYTKITISGIVKENNNIIKLIIQKLNKYFSYISYVTRRIH